LLLPCVALQNSMLQLKLRSLKLMAADLLHIEEHMSI